MTTQIRNKKCQKIADLICLEVSVLVRVLLIVIGYHQS